MQANSLFFFGLSHLSAIHIRNNGLQTISVEANYALSPIQTSMIGKIVGARNRRSTPARFRDERSCGPLRDQTFYFDCVGGRMSDVMKPMMTSRFPSSAQASVELYQGQSFVELSLDNVELGREIVGVVGEDFEITGNAATVPHLREAGRVLCGSRQ